jgi:hypothetical protein
MSANNKRVRRAIIDILWHHGPMTKEALADKLQEVKSIRQVPSPNSLSALLCKNPQVVSVGSQRVESVLGNKSLHMVFDIDRYTIRSKDDLIYTTPYSIMSPKQKADAQKCDSCGRQRIIREDLDICLTCYREGL